MDTLIESNSSNDTHESIDNDTTKQFSHFHDGDNDTDSPLPTFGNFSPGLEQADSHMNSSSLFNGQPHQITTTNISEGRSDVDGSKNMKIFRSASTSGFEKSTEQFINNTQNQIKSGQLCYSGSSSSGSSSSSSIPRCLTQNIIETYTKCNPDFKGQRMLLSNRILTKPDVPASKDSCDNIEGNLICRVHDIITHSSSKSSFEIQDVLGIIHTFALTYIYHIYIYIYI